MTALLLLKDRLNKKDTSCSGKEPQLGFPIAGTDVTTSIASWLDIIKELHSVFRNLSRNREEVVANSAAAVLTDEEFVRNLYNNEHSLFEQIRKFFKELAETFKQLTQSASWSQDAALTSENVRAIAEVFDRVAADTAATGYTTGKQMLSRKELLQPEKSLYSSIFWTRETLRAISRRWTLPLMEACPSASWCLSASHPKCSWNT